jgi:hypothetical protein
MTLQFHSLEHFDFAHSEDCSLCLNSLDLLDDGSDASLSSNIQNHFYCSVEQRVCSNSYFYSASSFKTSRAPPYQV